MYGRRRVGKTALVQQAFRGEFLLSFEGLENQPTRKQIRNFLQQLGRQTEVDTVTSTTDWADALLALLPLVRGKRAVIVLDEFQWMANYRTALVSVLKMVWDQHLAGAGDVTLILCGSIASFMVKKVIRSRALYGRIDLGVHLRPFLLPDTAQLLEGRGPDEVLLAQLVFGGVPQYLRLVHAYDSIPLGIEQEAFDPDGYFAEEYERIFVSHFGATGHYPEVLAALARASFGRSRNEIVEATDATGGGELTRVLYNLESAGFITSYTPFDTPSTSRQIRYVVTDPFLRFYFAFLQPAQKRGIANRRFIDHVLPSAKFRSWLGQSWELLCLEHREVLASLLGFGAVEYRVGPYFRHATGGRLSGVQIDLLFDRADRVVTLCEMKFRDAPIGIDVTREVQEKIDGVPSLRDRTVQKILVTKSEPTRELANSGYFTRVVRAPDLLRPITPRGK